MGKISHFPILGKYLLSQFRGNLPKDLRFVVKCRILVYALLGNLFPQTCRLREIFDFLQVWHTHLLTFSKLTQNLLESIKLIHKGH